MILSARLMLLVCTLSLAACAGQQTSPERHAVHAIHQLAQVQFDPNFRIATADSIRMMKPALEKFYQQGKADREAGMTEAQAAQRIAQFSAPDFLPASQMTHQFVGQSYAADRPQKERKILIEAITATYRDGYEGRP